MSKEFEELQASGDDWAATKVEIVKELSDAFGAGQLSKEEYKELLEDLIRTDKLDNESTNLQLKATFVEGVMGIVSAL